MTDPQSAAIASAALEHRNALIQYVVTIVSLVAVCITFAALGQHDALNTALGGLVGFATSARPGARTGGGAVAATTIGLALAGGLAGHLGA
jgi:hypothetical protein